MTIDNFQKAAHEFATYGGNTMYPVLGLAEEAGEVCGKVAKFIRKHEGITPTQAKDWVSMNEEYETVKEDISKELGDVLWMVAEVATTMGLKLSQIVDQNVSKLTERKRLGVIVGSGDSIEERLANAGRQS